MFLIYSSFEWFFNLERMLNSEMFFLNLLRGTYDFHLSLINVLYYIYWFTYVLGLVLWLTTCWKWGIEVPYYYCMLSLSSSISVVIQSLSHVFVIPWAAAHQDFLSSTLLWSLLKFMSIELVMLSKHLIFCCPLPLLPSIFPSIKVFSSE